jgi:Tol biopolymer transport system component/DNA-binding winged helix-turn-helix (wHTH) protein
VEIRFRIATLEATWRSKMNSETSEKRVCKFGLYEADLDRGILKRHGIPVRLQEQPFRILGVLLERPGEIISREELRNRLWPEGTFVEFDGSLNTALMKLRAVLNDDPENPRFVETVPKKGYRFIAPVQLVRGPIESALDQGALTLPASPVAELRPSSPDGPSLLTTPAKTVKGRHVLLGSMVFFLAGIAVAAAIVWRYWPIPEPRVVRVSQLTHTGRVAADSRIVTDGARLYFVSREGGHSTLMTTSIHGGSVERLASPFENTAIFDVSRDRTQLLIGPSAYEGSEIPVWIWPAHGGVPHRLGEVIASEAVWSPVGDAIAIAQGSRLLTVRHDGSDIKELQKFSVNPHSLVWSGDGAKIRFTVTNVDRGTDEMWEIGADGKNLARVLPNAPTERHDSAGAWSTDERYFLFTGGSDSRLSHVMDSISNVWASRERSGFFSRAKHQAIELTHGPVSFRSLADTGDSNRFFALGTHPEYQLIRMSPLTTAYDVILPDAGATDVDVTPDGEWLVYSLRENGALWKSRRNGKERIELTALPPGALAPEWSPDGKEILFTAFFLEKRPQLFIVPSAGGIPHAILPAGAAGSSQSGDWSPDGSQILFDYSERGESSLRILDRALAKTEILPGSQQFVQARWSPDGKHIAAIDGKTRQIVLYSLDQKKWSVIADAGNTQGMRWSADGNYVYYQELGDPEQAVYRIRLGRPLPEKILGFGRMLASMASQCHFTGVAPDGSIYATVDRGGTDVYALDLKLP